MKVLITYYSRTGNTEKAAFAIGSELSSRKIDVSYERINPLKEEGFFKSGMLALFHKEVPVLNTDLNIEDYDMVIVGSPVWAANPVPPVNSYLADVQGITGKKAAVFVTMISSGARMAINYMSEYIKNKGGILVSSVGLSKQDLVDEKTLKGCIAEFILQLTTA